jgi:hypothetical protein
MPKKSVTAKSKAKPQPHFEAGQVIAPAGPSSVYLVVDSFGDAWWVDTDLMTIRRAMAA